MSQDAIPPAAAPLVKSGHDPKHAKAPAYGMDNIPGNVLRARLHRMSEEEGMTDSEIASKLTEEYGGALLNNALRIYHLLGGRASAPQANNRHAESCIPSSQANTDMGGENDTRRENRYSFEIPNVPSGTVLPALQATLHVQPPALPPVGPPSPIQTRTNNVTDACAEIPDARPPQSTETFGVSDALPPIPAQSDSNKLFPDIL